MATRRPSAAGGDSVEETALLKVPTADDPLHIPDEENVRSDRSHLSVESEKEKEGEKGGNEKDESLVPDGGWGWVVCFGSFAINFILDGTLFSFGVLMLALLADLGEDKSTTSWIGSAQMGIHMIMGPVISILLQKFTIRQVTVAGSILAAAGFVASVFAPNVYVLIFTYGVVGGVGFGLVFLPAIIVVGLYFNKKRAIATGIATSGSGLGTFAYAYMTDSLLESFGWRGTVLILAGVLLNCAVCGLLFRPLVLKKDKVKGMSESGKQDKVSQNGHVLTSDQAGEPLLTHSDYTTYDRKHTTFPHLTNDCLASDMRTRASSFGPAQSCAFTNGHVARSPAGITGNGHPTLPSRGLVVSPDANSITSLQDGVHSGKNIFPYSNLEVIGVEEVDAVPSDKTDPLGDFSSPLSDLHSNDLIIGVTSSPDASHASVIESRDRAHLLHTQTRDHSVQTPSVPNGGGDEEQLETPPSKNENHDSQYSKLVSDVSGGSETIETEPSTSPQSPNGHPIALDLSHHHNSHHYTLDSDLNKNSCDQAGELEERKKEETFSDLDLENNDASTDVLLENDKVPSLQSRDRRKSYTGGGTCDADGSKSNVSKQNGVSSPPRLLYKDKGQSWHPREHHRMYKSVEHLHRVHCGPACREHALRKMNSEYGLRDQEPHRRGPLWRGSKSCGHSRHDDCVELKPQDVHSHISRGLLNPLLRRDIYYSGSVSHLPAYQHLGSMTSFMAAMTRASDSEDQDTDSADPHGGSSGRCRKGCNRWFPTTLLTNKIFVLLLVTFSMWTVQSVSMTYIPDLAVSSGISRSDAAFLISVVGIANVPGRLLAGVITDCLQVPSVWLYFVALSVAAVVNLLLPFCQGYSLLVICCAVFGLCMAVAVSMRTIVLAQQLGIDVLTESFGLVALFQGVAFTVNPPIAGKLIDEFHSFKPPFMMTCVMYGFSALATLAVGCISRSAKSPNTRDQHSLELAVGCSDEEAEPHNQAGDNAPERG